MDHPEETADRGSQPHGYSPRSGIHQGCLRGPASGADFDLALYTWSSFWGWLLVAVVPPSTRVAASPSEAADWAT